MQIRRYSPPAGLAAAVLIAGAVAGSASGAPSPPSAHGPGQQVQLDRACHETVANVRQAVKDAPNAQAQAIYSHLQVVTPGTVTGKIAFNLSGTQISVAGDRAEATVMSFGCGEATASGPRVAGGSGGSRVVSTLHRTFTKTGRYVLTFTLNPAGRHMLGQLASADNAYFKQHPHGQHPPTLAFGVALSYSPAR